MAGKNGGRWFVDVPFAQPARLRLGLFSCGLVHVALAVSACGTNGDRRRDGGRSNGEDAPSCSPCTTDDDCPREVCAQLGGDTYCAPTCTAAAVCTADRACAAVRTVTGAAVDVCVPRGDACGRVAEAGIGPSDGATGRPAGSMGPMAPVAGHIGVTGGTVSRLYFAVVGDTRPAHVDDTGGYPTAIVGKIFEDLESLVPPPPFAVATGDYLFASTGGGQAALQLDLYLHARRSYSGLLFPVLGNHECTGATASNCGPGNADGITDNYTQFIGKLLQPIGRTKPYYFFDVGSLTGRWTAKFVFVAANAWDAGQASWLETTLARPTTYTFVVRHEPASATGAPGVRPAEQILSQHPYTLSIVGHSHTYARSGVQEVIIGNGGAPLTSSTANYGFGLVQQLDDDTIQVDVVDYSTMRRDTSFGFALRADGSPAR